MDDIEKLFPPRRISSIATRILVFVYTPIGICIVFLRLCLLLNFIIAGQILGLICSENSGIIEIINRIFMAILGIWIKIEGKPLPCNIIASNQRSHLDGIILSHAMNVYCEDKWELNPNLCTVLKLLKNEKIFEDSNTAAGKAKPVIVFPEGSPTSGTALMKFQTSYFSQVKVIQSCSISASRIISISLSTVSSRFYSDLFWMLFNPVTFYLIRFSKNCINIDNMILSESADAVASEVAQLLQIPTLDITLRDKSDYLKRLRLEARHVKLSSFKYPPHLQEMASQIQEVTPHVPKEVILCDLRKTNSGDVTITNILEGVVKFAPVQPEKEKPKALNPPSARDLLEKRKAEMYEMARMRFKEKHGA